MKLKTIIIITFILSIITNLIGAFYVMQLNKPVYHFWFITSFAGWGISFILLFVYMSRKAKKNRKIIN